MQQHVTITIDSKFLNTSDKYNLISSVNLSTFFTHHIIVEKQLKRFCAAGD